MYMYVYVYVYMYMYVYAYVYVYVFAYMYMYVYTYTRARAAVQRGIRRSCYSAGIDERNIVRSVETSCHWGQLESSSDLSSFSAAVTSSSAQSAVATCKQL